MSLGFSSHAPLPFNRSWAMKAERLPEYLSTINALRTEEPPLEVYSGLEIDYIPDKSSPASYASQLDYTIGSIHFVDHYADGRPWEIDNTYDVFLQGLQNVFHNNVQEAISRYFDLTREMINKSKPTIVGHLDKIKMHNRHESFFREDELWYRREIKETLQLISKTGTIVEVNTRGIYQKKTQEPYPSKWVLELMHQMEIPITLSSDAHHPDDLITSFAETAHTLRTIGFTAINTLHEGKWKPLAFNEYGIQYR